jgi:hypothetical protein
VMGLLDRSLLSTSRSINIKFIIRKNLNGVKYRKRKDIRQLLQESGKHADYDKKKCEVSISGGGSFVLKKLNKSKKSSS